MLISNSAAWSSQKHFHQQKWSSVQGICGLILFHEMSKAANQSTLHTAMKVCKLTAIVRYILSQPHIGISITYMATCSHRTLTVKKPTNSPAIMYTCSNHHHHHISVICRTWRYRAGTHMTTFVAMAFLGFYEISKLLLLSSWIYRDGPALKKEKEKEKKYNVKTK